MKNRWVTVSNGRRKRHTKSDKWYEAILQNWMKARIAGAKVAVADAADMVSDQRIIGVKGDLEKARKLIDKALRNWDAATARQRTRKFGD